MKFRNQLGLALLMICSACAHTKVDTVSPEDAARLDRKLVKRSVIFEPGAEEGATVPDISAPLLRAVIVPEHLEGTNRLVERHREWILEGDVSLIGIPTKGGKRDAYDHR